MPIYHAKTALRIGDVLSAEAANLAAHIAIHNAPDEWHSGEIVHAVAN